MSLATLEKTVVMDLKAFGVEVEDVAEGVALKMWTAFKVIVMGLAPKLFSEFEALAVAGLEKVGTTDLADIESFILNGASADLKAALAALGSQYVQALIGIVKAL